ncbi:MAG: MarR family transcriptional regulator [Bacteroidetes bacterium]|nr:MAG: MarR family transcriptional regulator [Bacteroidota bacterium]
MKYNLDHCIGNKLRRLSRIVDGHFRSGLKDFNITENQMTILFLLHSMGTVDQGIIGKKLVLERSSISRNINVLLRNGYVSKNSEYRPQVFLTEQGIELVHQLIPLWETVMDNVILEIGDEGVEMINKLEKKLL